jgi:dihydrofolate reductase
MKKVSLIVAATTEYGIGKGNTIPWNIPEELNNFKRITTDVIDKSKKNCIIMGRNTWASLPKKPLPNRVNIVVSSSLIGEGIGNKNSSVVIINNILDAIKCAKEREDIETIFIIGGGAVYNEMINNHIDMIDKIYLSIINDKYYECDKHINIENIYNNFIINSENIHILERYIFMIFDKKKTIIDEPVD